jgi:hypothetical protein
VKEKSQKGLVLFLTIVLVVLWVGWFFLSGPAKKPGRPANVSSSPVAEEPAAAISNEVKPRVGRNPFQFGAAKGAIVSLVPPASAKKTVPVAEIVTPPSDSFILQGFFEKGGRLIASINDQLVGEGDFISGWKVAQVTKLQVVLEKNGQTKILKNSD